MIRSIKSSLHMLFTAVAFIATTMLREIGGVIEASSCYCRAFIVDPVARVARHLFGRDARLRLQQEQRVDSKAALLAIESMWLKLAAGLRSGFYRLSPFVFRRPALNAS